MRPPTSPQVFRHVVQEANSDSRQTFLVFDENRNFVGLIDFSNIVRGLFQNAYVAYFAVAPHHRHGYMKAALMAALRYAFGPLRLHRVEANIQPGNIASLALVRGLGFTREGYSPKYLRVGGRWSDHERWAMLRENWSAIHPGLRKNTPHAARVVGTPASTHRPRAARSAG
jgi:ribosomal-protein-alanine N-acetyltransferase